MVEPIEFDTERLRLRQWRADDREPFAQLNADPRVMAYFPSLLDRTASDALAERIESLIEERGWGFWAAELKSTGEFIGFVGLHVPMAELPFSPCVEIGWRLAYAHWGRGFATEAARGALHVGFDILNFSEIVSFMAAGNARSRAVMERLGMVRAAETFQHPALPADHPLQEHCLYRLAKAQWEMDRGLSEGGFNLETAVGRAGVCGGRVGWQTCPELRRRSATTPWGSLPQEGATPPGGPPAVQSGA